MKGALKMTNTNTKKIIFQEVKDILGMKNERPYVFRTRVERGMLRIAKLSEKEGLNEIESLSKEIKDKLNFMSDKSNQTSDGTLQSYMFLKDDLCKIMNATTN